MGGSLPCQALVVPPKTSKPLEWGGGTRRDRAVTEPAGKCSLEPSGVRHCTEASYFQRYGPD